MLLSSSEQQGPASGAVCAYPHIPSQLGAGDLPQTQTLTSADFTLQCIQCKTLFSPLQADFFLRPGSSNVSFWQCGMVWLWPFALCSLLLICFWVLPTQSLHSKPTAQRNDSYFFYIQIDAISILSISASNQAAIPIITLNTCIALYIVFVICITNPAYQV